MDLSVWPKKEFEFLYLIDFYFVHRIRLFCQQAIRFRQILLVCLNILICFSPEERNLQWYSKLFDELKAIIFSGLPTLIEKFY